jgi:tetratricopeptide (TPR) repeat protein
MIVQHQGDYEEARGLCEQSLKTSECLGDESGRAASLGQLGMIAQKQGKYEEARGLYGQSLQIFEYLGDQKGRASSLHQLGMIVQHQGDYEEARGLYEQSMGIVEQLGNQRGRASTLGQLGMLAYEQGDLENALKYAIQAFILFDTLHSPSHINAQQLITSIRSQMDEATFTGHWRALAGDLPLPDSSAENASQQMPDFSPGSASQQIMQALIDLIQAPTWEESKSILESHPELLQPDIDVTLQEWAMQQENESASESIEEYRLLLARCRDMGIDVAFAELQGEKSPDAAFATALNRICGEVVVTLRAGDAGRQKVLATQLERMLKEDLPIEGARDFLQVLVIWLHGQDTQTLVEKLQPVFRNAYDQMVVAVEQEETDNTDEEGALKIEDLPGVVSSALLQGTVEQRQQMAEELIKAQQQVPPEQASLGNFFGCLAAALRGETPEIASLEAPFTDLWQEFQDALAIPSGEEDQQQEEKHD